MNAPCILCASAAVSDFRTGYGRSYLKCANCGLIFVPREQVPDDAKQKARYDLHVNSASDAGYVAFLGNLVGEMVPHLQTGWKGLDFGCGRVPVLSALMRRQGFDMDDYDKFYHSDVSLLKNNYDYLVSSETIEHITDLRQDLEMMFDAVGPGGVIGIMTQMYDGVNEFSKWHYVRDVTHVNFFCRQTFEWIARAFGLKLISCTDKVAVFEKCRPLRGE